VVAGDASAPTTQDDPVTSVGAVHHLELWVPDLAQAQASIGWLLGELGYRVQDTWPGGCSWVLGDTYVVLESGTDLRGDEHDRCRPGLNHLAFHAGAPGDVDDLARRALEHGWSPLFADRYPHAGGPEHHAAYLENAAGFEVELVASA